ncbi:MAG: cell filamentation protein Fic [Flavobacteriia bacterium]|nr:MAG: cell filamentation protein Fic [Flavobacteriia bacterium]
MGSPRENIIIDFIMSNGNLSSKEIFDRLNLDLSYATLKRILTQLIRDNKLETTGKGKGTKYRISTAYGLIRTIDLNRYYEKEIDERAIQERFNLSVITETLTHCSVFTNAELETLDVLQRKYLSNIERLSENEYKKELDRLAIDLSWKSSQIEGNTYSLLETEKLLKEKETASGKTKEEAVMLLNHKEALDFIIEHTDYLDHLSVSKIEDIHSLLTNDLGIERNLRTYRVGISGTNYRPLDNQFQIKEALEKTCELINTKNNTFEKALLTLVLISYIQPFTDGNKRTARIVSNAILMHNKHCPLSFRTVDSIDYKKAMLVFYEQNNISAIKDIFMTQFEFAVNTYF